MESASFQPNKKAALDATNTQSGKVESELTVPHSTAIVQNDKEKIKNGYGTFEAAVYGLLR